MAMLGEAEHTTTHISGSDLIGKPVSPGKRGEEVGRVGDVAFDKVSNQIVALIVASDHPDKQSRMLSWGGVRTIREDAVVAKSEGMIVESKQLLAYDRILQFGKDLVGKQLMTTDGRKLGKVVDIYFNVESGRLIGYEIINRGSPDAMSDRIFTPAGDIVRYGQDGVIVSAVSARILEEQLSQLKRTIREQWQSILKSFESALASTHTDAHKSWRAASIAEKGQRNPNVRESLRESSPLDQYAIGAMTEQARNQLKQVLAEHVVGQAEGHFAQHTVLTDDNEFIVVAGQVVSQEEIGLARKHHKEAPLLESVGLDVKDILDDNAHELRKVIRHHAAEWHSDGTAIVDSLRETAVNLADDARARLKNAHDYQ